MKYVRKRNTTYYYRRRVPYEISHLTSINIVRRSLSRDRSQAYRLASRYNLLFDAAVAGHKLGEGIDDHIVELGLGQSRGDLYQQYLDVLEVGEDRLKKVTRILGVIKELLPKELEKTNISLLENVRANILRLPKRSLSKYKGLSVQRLLTMQTPEEDRLTPAAAKDYIAVLNSFLKYLYGKDTLSKVLTVKYAKNTVNARDARKALEDSTVLGLREQAVSLPVKAAYQLLYLSGMRPSEALVCKVSTIDGIRCFDLSDPDLQLKNPGSHRIIPVHSSIDDPEKLLEAYRSVLPRQIARGMAKQMQGVTPYSMRHSFADNLVKLEVDTHIVSELMGHRHGTMTLDRYAKGLSVKAMKEAIELLFS